MRFRKHAVGVGLLLGCAIIATTAVTLKGIPYPAREKQWSIGIYAGQSPFHLRPSSNAANPVLSAADVTDVPATFVADPFMIKRDAIWYMFFEVMNANTRQGDIGVATSGDGSKWRYGGVVLDEPFHLSYPYVFESGGAQYMIPESLQAQSVRLYKADLFPTRWTFVRPVLAGHDYSDPSLVRYGDRWWLFVTTNRYTNGTLSLYYADRLEGPWNEHPMSPVVRDNPHGARPGGRVFTLGDKLFRYAQDDAPTYGIQVWAFEITELTTTSYRETPVGDSPITAGSGRGWNASGMHHVDPHPVGEQEWIACVDGYRNTWTLRSWP